ncbi:hypothetical protein SS50377_24509 [Spironucleus salmonicida]|uniref:Nuclear factor related to kappa-B-binding protein second winged helix domain-containing protein n=1 Tax=Spironucleus salmonicida TaxID=348837 RepID=V6LNX8_9EUKA|nr:hypothetical protein SS50377_24509 [Spironucleus salmonicida]|eukprot:EST45948.1 hypothetical protein SS50377_13927 [Spironucleus salmonicida]
MINPRILLERQVMQQRYKQFMHKNAGIQIEDPQYQFQSAKKLFTMKNGLQYVPAFYDLDNISLPIVTPQIDKNSVLNAQILSLKIEKDLPIKNIISNYQFASVQIITMQQKQKKAFAQLKGQPHKQERDASYHQLEYEIVKAETSDFDIVDNQKIGQFKMVDGRILESTKFDCQKLWYKAGTSKVEAIMFGIPYEEMTSKTHTENQLEVQSDQNLDVFNQHVKKQYKNSLQSVVYEEPIVISNVAHPSDITSQKFIKDLLTRQQKLSAAPVVKSTPKLPKEKPYQENYEKKMIIGRKYGPVNLPQILEGFQKNSQSHVLDTALFYVPTLCHALVAIISCQQCQVKLREEDIFLSTLAAEHITLGRQAILIRDICILIRDKYPKIIEKFIPKPLKCFETIITALLFMVSPDDSLVESVVQIHDEVQYMTRSSVYDLKSGLVEQLTHQDKLKSPPSQGQTLQLNIGPTAIMTEDERYLLEGDKGQAFRRQFYTLSRKQEPAQKSTKQDFSIKTAEPILREVNKYTSQASQLVNQTIITQISQGSSIIQALESNCQVYGNQNNFSIIYENQSVKTVDTIKLTHQELQQIDTRMLFLSEEDKLKVSQIPEKKQKELNSDSDSDVLADDLPQVPPPSRAIIALSSPLLGEFMLCQKTPVNSYFGADLDDLNRIAFLVERQLEIDVQEMHSGAQLFKNGEFDKIYQNDLTKVRMETLLKSKQKVALSLDSTGQRYDDLDRLHFRAQERLRYFLLPHVTFPYVVKGRKSLSLKQKLAEQKPQSYKNLAPNKQIAQHLSKIAAVQDAAARLPGRFGTREDIMDRCCDGQFYSQRDSRLQNKVSCALDRLRLHFVDEGKKMRLAMYNASEKIWMLAPGRLQVVMGDIEQEEWPSDLYEMYCKGTRTMRMMNRQ